MEKIISRITKHEREKFRLNEVSLNYARNNLLLHNAMYNALFRNSAVADPDFELRRGSGFNLLAQPAFLPSVISSFFTQNTWGLK